MARVTVEDCIEKVPNRFGLVLMAGHRARSIANGAALTIDRDNDKNPVVALREIADDTVVPDELRETIITTLQRVDERTEAEDEAEPQHLNLAEAELIRARHSDRDGGQEERYCRPREPLASLSCRRGPRRFRRRPKLQTKTNLFQRLQNRPPPSSVRRFFVSSS